MAFPTRHDRNCTCLGHATIRVVGRVQSRAPAMSLAVASTVFGIAPEAQAAEDPGAVSVAVVETLDLWRNTRGGVKVGYTQLSKFQVILDLDGEADARPDWRARAHYFHANGESLSGGRLGDLQGASNIEALSVDRLFEAWVERRVGETGSVRVGLLDVNADFDSIGTSSLFLNSSHGIGPDLSASGLNGLSNYPVTSLGALMLWSPKPAVTLRMAVFDGVPGDPSDSTAFAAVKLSARDGALVMGQVDWRFAGDAQASFGTWRYTAAFDRLDQDGARQRGWTGAYGWVEGPLPLGGSSRGWVRVGLTDAKVAVVTNYLGAGVVFSGPIARRPSDQLGFAVARAGLGRPVRARDGLPGAETIYELTYRLQMKYRLALQPDLQYVRHPASQAGLRDALIVGLRIVVTADRRFGKSAP